MPQKASDISEKVKLYLVIALALAAASIAYFRFIHKKNDTGVTVTGPPPAEVTFDISQIAKTEDRRPQAPGLPLYDSLNGDIKDIFEPVKPAIEPKPAIQTKLEPPPAGTAKQTTAPEVTLELKGTILGGNNPMAIINDKFVRTGEKIGDYQVVKITPNSVYLKAGSHQKVIQVLNPARK
jgi:hypothetical protein